MRCGTQFSADSIMEGSCIGEQTFILKGLCKKADAKGQAIRSQSGWDTDGRQTQRIGKIGVIAEIGIQRDGIRLNLFDAIDGCCRRQYEDINLVQLLPGAAFVRLQRVHGIESIGSAVTLCGQDRQSHGGVHVPVGRLRSGAIGEPALCNEGAVEDQLACFGEGSKIDLHGSAAEIGQLTYSLFKLGLRKLIAEEGEMLVRRQAKAESSR